MLKLPKGLKKKKKGKKSKKDQELFTEEELEQYRREHQNHSALNSAAPSDSEEQQQPQSQHQLAASVAGAGGEKSGETDEEWSKFAALTSGIDSVLKKTQGDLDRIKSTSFFQKVPTKVEQEEREREERERERERCAQEEQRRKAAEEAAQEEKRSAEELISAVVELSESEHNSEAEEDIFDTGYIDAITRGELPIAYVPESPVLESFDGPDPFDTSYAEKVIKGPEVSKRGKKLVSIGSAVEVLTGRVDGAGTGAAKQRRQRRGPQNLLLASFDEGDQQQQQQQQQGEQGHDDAVNSDRKDSTALTLLDDSADLPSSNIEIDLSVSLHLNLQKQQQQQQQQDEEYSQIPEQPDLDEFDELKSREPLLVAGSDNLELLLGKPEVKEATGVSSDTTSILILDAFDAPESDDPFYTGFVERLLPATAVEDDEFDPRAITEEEKEEEEAGSVRAATPDLFSADHGSDSRHTAAPLQDLLSVSSSDLTGLGDKPLEVAAGPHEVSRATNEQAADPFDTTAIDLIVAPGKAELKFLEEELLRSSSSSADPRGPCIIHSLSDPDFDPRADNDDNVTNGTQAAGGPEDVRLEQDLQSLVQRKSSLSLHISAGGGGVIGVTAANRSKSVVFAVVTPDLLKLDGADRSSVTKKPLTPYYSRESSLPDLEADPFDTSFVPPVAPTSLELSLLEQELTSTESGDDFNPRAEEFPRVEQIRIPVPVTKRSAADLLGSGYDQQQSSDAQKVLTPARLGVLVGGSIEQPEELDPFDTTIAHNLQPGRAELKLLEDELIPTVTSAPTTDILSDAAQEPSSVFVKVLTPQVGGRGSLDFGGGGVNDAQSAQQQQQCEVDPFRYVDNGEH
ncbi:protein stoned-A [Anopheles aquasalis]|uniref:protein stoned-A n=1 Tax=Anopheles aquasalis TaxID=42839 RepID=UPI00215B4030|nr:protein stoned-A [Anopheles aquasalis]